MIFQGRTEELCKMLEKKMFAYSENLEYEKANKNPVLVGLFLSVTIFLSNYTIFSF